MALSATDLPFTEGSRFSESSRRGATGDRWRTQTPRVFTGKLGDFSGIHKGESTTSSKCTTPEEVYTLARREGSLEPIRYSGKIQRDSEIPKEGSSYLEEALLRKKKTGSLSI